MKLIEAYKGWGGMLQNQSVYGSTKKAFGDAWHKLSWQEPCSYYTKEILGQAIKEPRMRDYDKKMACSTMLAVLDWANFFDGENPAPDFTVDDLMEYTRPQEIIDPAPRQEEPSETPAESVITDMEEVRKVIPETIKEDKMSTNVRNKRKVCQIDPKTFEVIKTWDSITDARNKLGPLNINRSIVDKIKAGGYYWAHADACSKSVERIKAKETGKSQPDTSKSATDITDLSDGELIEELKRRGYTGTLTITKNIDL